MSNPDKRTGQPDTAQADVQGDPPPPGSASSGDPNENDDIRDIRQASGGSWMSCLIIILLFVFGLGTVVLGILFISCGGTK